MQMWVKNPNCNKRNIRGRKEWLCELCTLAYDRKQYCEFCFQVYLESTADCSDLDGKEWAQCEARGNCSRWSHVGCLAKEHGKDEEEVVSAGFKYICRLCTGKLGGKRRKARGGGCKSSLHVAKGDVKRKRICPCSIS
eukprot:TRINITY_DN7875_c0_g2_i1.p3 TRINITY_DN7875_c0_g2~~TRINITY_DN7875_c0_g2_i1.p3  ORF type:complete len:138 (-),score=16.53 TRINITY_DN7875_c0_g2_i1:110-523(-)